jgi:hypothetical protein
LEPWTNCYEEPAELDHLVDESTRARQEEAEEERRRSMPNIGEGDPASD